MPVFWVASRGQSTELRCLARPLPTSPPPSLRPYSMSPPECRPQQTRLCCRRRVILATTRYISFGASTGVTIVEASFPPSFATSSSLSTHWKTGFTNYPWDRLILYYFKRNLFSAFSECKCPANLKCHTLARFSTKPSSTNAYCQAWSGRRRSMPHAPRDPCSHTIRDHRFCFLDGHLHTSVQYKCYISMYVLFKTSGGIRQISPIYHNNTVCYRIRHRKSGNNFYLLP